MRRSRLVGDVADVGEEGGEDTNRWRCTLSICICSTHRCRLAISPRATTSSSVRCLSLAAVSVLSPAVVA
jgi:hypothetical protein